MEKYQIVEFKKYDKRGELIYTYFYIEKSWKIFGRTFWTPVRENTKTELFPSGYYRKKLEFSYLVEAQTFIENILVQCKPYDMDVRSVVQVY
jgi:hypothetical protein